MDSVAIDEAHGRKCAFYFGRRHGLIHRHLETIVLEPDQTASWQLTVDLELPSDEEARCGQDDDKCFFLFPLLFLKKSEGRVEFGARDEDGTVLPLPNRVTCDWISALAAAKAGNRLLSEHEASEAGRWTRTGRGPLLPPENLEYVLRCVTSFRSYEAFVVLSKMLNDLDEERREVWDEAGFTDELKMLVEHSLVWVPLRGRPGERRSIRIGHGFEPQRRPFVRWNFGELIEPSRWQRRKRWESRRDNPSFTLDTGEAKYGRLGYRISLSALGERLTKPLAWMPIEFDHPTIYTQRCNSYHFELICPAGLTPRAVKMGTEGNGHDPSAPRPGELGDGAGVGVEDVEPTDERTTLGVRAAHVYLPGGRVPRDVVFRATVGIGTGAFPILWLMMGAITAILLWTLAAIHPEELLVDGSEYPGRNEIAAGILLVVPALLGAVVIGAEDGPVSSLISGAKMLLLTAGLCAAGAASVLIDARPFGFGPQTSWTICAAVATMVTVPLGTSWLLSHWMVWRQLKKLNTIRRQEIVLGVLIGVGVLTMIGLVLLSGNGREAPSGLATQIVRTVLAVGLILLPIPLILLATNRVGVRIKDDRKYLAVGASTAALVCLALGCIELRAAFDAEAGVHEIAEWVALLLLVVLAPSTGPVLKFFGSFFHPKAHEIHLSPSAGAAVINHERIREIRELRRRQSTRKSRFTVRRPSL